MNDTEILRKALERYRNATHENAAFKDNVIIFLEKEIDRYRDKIEELSDRMNTMYGARTAEEVTKKLEEWRREQDALTTRVEQLGQIVENKIDQLLDETVLTFTEERTGDGGCVTIKNTNCYQDFIGILLENGYFVCCHINDENNGETITIEFWRA